MVICQPRDGHVLKELLESAFSGKGRLLSAIRTWQPKNETLPCSSSEIGVGEILMQGKRSAIIALGHMCQTALQSREIFLKEGIEATVIDPVFVKPLDSDLFCDVLSPHTIYRHT